MYLRHPNEYEHFLGVFDYINNLSSLKNYFESDLFNIEEILSIIEMSESVGGNEEIDFKRFLKDTINYYTPKIGKVDERHIDHLNFLGGSGLDQLIGSFVISLANIRLVSRVQVQMEEGMVNSKCTLIQLIIQHMNMN
jgi:hypothetical protein